MKKLLIALAACALGVQAETIDVPAGTVKKIEAGKRFEGGVLVKTGAGTLDLTGAVLANQGLEIQAGAVYFAGGSDGAVTARFVKFDVTKTRPAKSAPPEYGNSGSQFSEFRLFLAGKMLPMPAGAKALNDGGGREDFGKGIDSDLTTKCYRNPLVIDLGKDVTFDAYSYATANDAIGRDPYCWTVSAGVADGSIIHWLGLGSVTNYEAPKERNKDIGKTFPVMLKDVIPVNYPVKVCGKGCLILSGVTETLERISGNGLIELEDNAGVSVTSTADFAGTVAGFGCISYKK